MPTHAAAVGLGTLLRHLLELLDGDLDGVYAGLGLDYRPRYTPVVDTLLRLGPSSIQQIAKATGITHSAASQTVAQMAAKGLVDVRPGHDLRRRVVSLSPKMQGMLPAVRQQWAYAATAASSLDDELAMPLVETLREAIAALERMPFRERLRAATRPRQPRKRISSRIPEVTHAPTR